MALSSPNILAGTWFLIERDLVEKSDLKIGQGDWGRPWQGNLPAESGDPFQRDFLLYPGVNVLAVKYVFKIIR
jgi:hypothetical protein